MNDSEPQREQPPAGKEAQRGQTTPVQGETQQGVPRAPHERDESADSQQAGEPSGRRMGQAAHDDMARGLVDTDKGPALDRAYDKVREGTSDPDKKFRP
jgi:hypothetical protein